MCGDQRATSCVSTYHSPCLRKGFLLCIYFFSCCVFQASSPMSFWGIFVPSPFSTGVLELHNHMSPHVVLRGSWGLDTDPYTFVASALPIEPSSQLSFNILGVEHLDSNNMNEYLLYFKSLNFWFYYDIPRK